MRRKRSRGQSLVEFALVLPILMFIVFGVVDGARLVYAYNAVSNAAREAGRTAIINQYVPAIRGKASQQGTLLNLPTGDPGDCNPNGTDPTTPNREGTCVAFLNNAMAAQCAATPKVGCNAVVNVRYLFRGITPGVSAILGSLVMSSTTRQVIESACNTSACATR